MPPPATTTSTGGRRRRLRLLSRTDRVVITLMVRRPAAARHRARLAAGRRPRCCCPFTNWDGIGALDDDQVGRRPRTTATSSRSTRRSGRRSSTTCSGWPCCSWSRPRSACSSRCCWTRRCAAAGSTRPRSTCRWCSRWRWSASSGSCSTPGTRGCINAVLRQPAIDWYGDPNVNIWAVLVAAGWRHVGYIMLLYLAGLKGVDPSLREAAAVDGATESADVLPGRLPGRCGRSTSSCWSSR